MRFFSHLGRLFRPAPQIGGLEITSTAVRFLLIENGEKALTVSSPLPRGTLKAGSVADPVSLRAALREVRSRVKAFAESLAVILVVPPEQVYLQSFSLPALEHPAFEEAVALNLKMLSPIDFSRTYASWQKVGENKDANQIELLGAFAARDAIDALSTLAAEAGFSIAAVEFPALSLARVVQEWGAGILPQESYLVLRIGAEGIELMILRSANLYFHQFTPWEAIQGEFRANSVSLDDVRSFLGREIQRFMSFYSGRWGGSFSRAILITEKFETEFLALLQSTFSLDARSLTLTSFNHLPPLWYPVLGAAARGRVPRARDQFINVSAKSVRDEYEESRTLLFVRVWRNAFITLFAFFLILFVGGDGVLARQAASVERAGIEEVPPDAARELAALTAEAQSFNTLAARGSQAVKGELYPSLLLETLTRLAADTIALKRITVLPGADVTVSGIGRDEAEITAFKNKLIRDPLFSNVDLPPANLRAGEGDTVFFTLTAKLVSHGSP